MSGGRTLDNVAGDDALEEEKGVRREDNGKGLDLFERERKKQFEGAGKASLYPFRGVDGDTGLKGGRGRKNAWAM